VCLLDQLVVHNRTAEKPIWLYQAATKNRHREDKVKKQFESLGEISDGVVAARRQGKSLLVAVLLMYIRLQWPSLIAIE